MFKVIYKVIDKNTGKILKISDDQILFPDKKEAQNFIRRIKRNKASNEIISTIVYNLEEK